MNPLQDVFISYGRADSKHFAKNLNDRLVELGYTVWFDFEDIPLGVDYQKQIDDGIEKADNFLFVIAPHATNSAYCRLEIELALKRKKRIIPLLHVENIDQEIWQQRNLDGTDDQWAEYESEGLHSCHTNMHPEIGKINWVQCKEGINDFEQSLQQILALLELEKGYVHQHTVLLNQALEWERHQKQTRYLLTGEDKQEAVEWLAVRFADKQPPLWPTDLHYEYITESIKNGDNLMTQVFLAHAEEDGAMTETVRRSLMRSGITTWSYRADIEYGDDFEGAIARGVEQADNVLLLMSSHSLKSKYCQMELERSLQLNKRLIIMLAGQVEEAEIPVFLRNRQYIDLTDNETEADYLQDEDDLLRVLKQDATYHKEHKVLLTKALKWERQQRNPCILLQGYELQHALAWREVAKAKDGQGPTEIQEDFIEASQSQTAAVAPDVFISYSRADSDFARRLNNALQRQRKRTWFDQESIASGADFQQEIYKGIETSNFFLFVLSPRAVRSPYCADEVEYAAKLNKRMVTVLHRPVNPKDLHPELAKVQWIDFTANKGEFDTNFKELLRTLDTDPEHLRFHTQLLVKAIEWDKKGRREDVLLRGSDLAEAEQWLLGAVEKQPSPTALQGEYVTASRLVVEMNQQRSVRLQRLVIGGLASLLVLALVGGGVAVQQLKRAEKAIKQAELSQARSSGLGSLTLLNEGKDFEAWMEAIRAGTILQKYQITQPEGLNALQQVMLKSNKVRSFTGHDGWVRSVSFSPDGQTLVSGSDDTTVKLWDVVTGEQLNSFTGHDNWVWSVGFSPDGQTLVSGSADKTIKLWDVESGKELRSFTGHDRHVLRVRFSPDGQTLVSGSADKTAKLWDVATGEQLRSFTGHDESFSSVSFSSDGQTLVSGSADTMIKLWDVTTGEQLRSFTGHDEAVISVSFSPDGQTLVSGSSDKTIKLWDVATGEQLRSFVGHDEPVTVSFSPDGQTLVSGSADETIKLWDVATGQEIRSFTGHNESVISVSFSPDGKSLVSSSLDKTIKFWDVETGEQPHNFTGHDQLVSSVSFSPDGKSFVSSSSDKTIKLWDVETGEELRSFTGHDLWVMSVSFSADGKTLISGSTDKTINLWDVETGEQLRSFTGHDESVNSVSFSADGKTLVSGSADKTIKLWDVTTGEELRGFIGHDESVNSVSFSADGKTFISGSTDKTIKLWDVATGKELRSFTGHDDWINSVSFSPDGKTLVSGSSDKTIKLWDVTTGEEIRNFIGHDNWVMGVRFSADGKTLVSGSADKTIKLWDVTTGQQLRSFIGHDDWVTSVSFSPNGKTLISGSSDKTIKLWDLKALSLDAMVAHGCDWLRFHVAHNPVELRDEDKRLCDGL
ncbi:MAG: TIR domain-containing protein [Cyanobacteria bacterium P01_F01_bin.150]